VRHDKKVLELLENSGRALRNLLFKITLSEDTADDLMQELFVRLSTSRGFFRSKKSFAYAWRTALNLAVDHYRRKRPVAPYDEQLDDQNVGDSPLQELIADEHLGIILDEVAKLRGPGRDIVIMRYLEQREYGDIARLLGKRENYIRSQLSKTLTRLRETLNGQLDIKD
jgi:RNA polymerase sigma-70 factor, ECF subfamily